MILDDIRRELAKAVLEQSRKRTIEGFSSARLVIVVGAGHAYMAARGQEAGEGVVFNPNEFCGHEVEIMFGNQGVWIERRA